MLETLVKADLEQHLAEVGGLQTHAIRLPSGEIVRHCPWGSPSRLAFQPMSRRTGGSGSDGV
jgi:hypothetical protein